MKITAKLLDSKKTDTSGEEFVWGGGPLAVVQLAGTLDGATATIYIDLGIGFGTNVTELAMTELGTYNLSSVPNGATVKATVSGAGAGTDLNCLMVDA